MLLTELFDHVPEIEIESLMADSRLKRPNSIFFCEKGMQFDGHRFVDQAIVNGAKVIVHSDEIPYNNNDVTYIRVKDVNSVFNRVADAFYGYPSHQLLMFGVTGTNGKSSIARIIRDVLDGIMPCGYIGTIGIQYGNVQLPPLLTTPNIDDLHHILRNMVDSKMKACSLEASSIGIEQGRVDAIDFDACIYTNLTHDHLDYHGTMENYFEAKKKIFDSLKEEAVAVINIDDPYALRMVEDAKCHVVTYGMNENADYCITNYSLYKDRTVFTLRCNGLEYELETNLVAKFNIYNLVGAIACLNMKGITIETMMPTIKHISQIEGRMERIDLGQPFNVVIDYAHTPDGIEQLCRYAAAITPKDKRIISVNGSAGKRDRAKRPEFGRILDHYADMIILTEEDPRNENPIEICEEIATGIHDKPYVIIEGRYDAIRQAVEIADEGDTIIIMGKGDERYIAREFGREPYEGDDAIAKEVLEKYYFGNREGDF